ncbi:MAG: 4Fe-4S binding protein, partial [Chromatiaceae bacterium]|nr:4Fe-4S binding protein [Chromatiaceae bacterium]
MSTLTGITRGGAFWTPAFVTDLDQVRCIGCGRCYKVCPRDVFELVDRDDLDL